jgi:hypothetical protein
MRYSFRLAELVGHMPDPRKRPGTIKEIVEHTGLDRHQVAALLKNEVKYIPLKALSRLCDFLVDRGYVAADALPGALFSVEPENFWELLARRLRLDLCVGVRRADPGEWPEGAWVVASDSVLLGELLNGVSTLGGTRHHRIAGGENGNRAISSAPHPEHLKQSLVWSPGQGTREEVHERAREVYDDFSKNVGDKALVCLGSIKSNPVVELLFAEAFGAEPFKSQDDCASPKKRACPFFLRYRNDDPHPDSCAGGTRLSKSTPSEEPGLYYETANGTWAHCNWDAPEHDAALVFYVHRESQGRLEMALSGFSGRATRQLAKTLATRAEDFWPPVYEGHGMQIGAFIVQYTFPSPADQMQDLLRTDIIATTKIIPLDGEVIERRMEQHLLGTMEK